MYHGKHNYWYTVLYILSVLMGVSLGEYTYHDTQYCCMYSVIGAIPYTVLLYVQCYRSHPIHSTAVCTVL